MEYDIKCVARTERELTPEEWGVLIEQVSLAMLNIRNSMWMLKNIKVKMSWAVYNDKEKRQWRNS